MSYCQYMEHWKNHRKDRYTQPLFYAEMAASLQGDGFTILFDDSSISAKANAANRAAVNKAARRVAQ